MSEVIKNRTAEEIKLIEHMYIKEGVSMKSIATYFVEIGRPIDESRISRHLKSKGLSGKKGGPLKTKATPTAETVYSMALRLMRNNAAC